MENTFNGESFTTVFGESIRYHIIISLEGVNIIDDFSEERGHLTTRIRVDKPLPSRHLFVRDYMFNQDILCRGE